MASSFAALRAKQGNAIDKIKQKIEEMRNTGGGVKDPTLDDPTYWNPTHVRGKDGTGEVVMRFLPAPEGEDDPFVKYIDYAIEGPNGWYINRSRQSLGGSEKDPVNDYCIGIFKRIKAGEISKENGKKLLPQRSEKYTANILILDDPNMPENNGKVFRWRFGPQVFNLIHAAMFPEFSSIDPINPFDPIEGANFHFRVYTKKIADRSGDTKAVPSYDKSGFAAPSPLVKNIEDFDEIWNREHPLKPIIDPSTFKSYDELKREFDRVMGNEQKSFLDTDEPLSAQAKDQPTKPDPKPQQTMKELLDDDLPPFDMEDDSKETASEFADDDSDWFNSLKK